MLAAVNISKSFGGAVALRGVSVQFAPGEVVALVGENGAGKSTLLKVLAAVVGSDGGTATIDGTPYAPRSQLDAERAGVALVFQEQNVNRALTIAENIMLGRLRDFRRFGLIDWTALNRAAQAILDRIGAEFTVRDDMAMLDLGQMKTIDAVNAHRRRLAEHYFECFGNQFEAQTGAQLPLAAFDTSNWHLFQIILPDRGPTTRADFMTRLKEEYNVGTGFHYAAIHLFTLYRARGFHEGMFPESERIGRLTVTLPMFYAMTKADVERVVDAVNAVLAK